ncbi:hypothetical protein [Streptomyces sp. NRRL B-3229]|uniref:golvesin C-terminal-like domain-containing protein n=1 Tax=Streptomyces sp. NRRL B-3229 TaxID=1463836 RepID=UPI000690668C|nr:hypothetical protein [Streptomyces sp. NRRL B-3229]
MTAAADSDGLHLLVADSRTGYAWKTAAVLSEPQLPADTWVGNECVMDDHHAAVAYAPRTFTNHEDTMLGGAFTAIVDLDKGSVTKLPFNASLAYFDPSCNPATHTAVFTAYRADKTRLVTVNTHGKALADVTAAGQITSPAPIKDAVIAAAGNRLVHIDRHGAAVALAETRHAPYDIHVQADGTVSYLDRTGDTEADVKTTAHGKTTTVATGRLTAMNLRQGAAGALFLTGRSTAAKSFKASGITALNVSPDADLSSQGRLAVDPVVSPAVQAGLDHIADAGKGFSAQKTKEPTPQQEHSTTSHILTVTGTATATGHHTEQTVSAPDTTAGSTTSPSLTGSKKPQTTMSMMTTADTTSIEHDPVDTDRWCSVPRNDVGTQALQPTPNQVEWAVDMAVRGDLRSSYLTQGGWRSQTGIGTIDPQGMFPVPTLNTGGRIPAQVELGILAQESNLWQAESGAIPGQMGNPLAAVDGFYGHQSGGSLADYWTIHWDESDCGYGVGQVTDGMRMAGHEKAGETARDPDEQRAIALDYATNIAASLYILADKWNEVHQSGQTITVNNDDPAKPENWFAAVWNYNLGFNTKADAGTNGNWGLGWYNNPANPVYPASRLSFMNTDMDPLAAKDAAHPQNWPYEEKVMGWAAWSIDTGHSYATSGRQDWPGESGFSSAGFRPAYWNGTSDAYTVPGSATYNRAHVSPPLDTFCNTQNNCDTADPPSCPDAGCYTQYWWNASNATWKTACASTCGFENIKYQTLISEPGRGTRLQYGTPVCSGAPTGAVVVDDVPTGTNTWSDCGTTSTSGSFQFTFYPDPNATGPGLGQYDAKADLHQIGGGYDGHFWYAHTRDADHLGGDGGRMTVLGDWKFGSAITGGQGKVYVHIPDTGANTTDATYQVVTKFGTFDETVSQDANESNSWVSLGGYRFGDTPPEVKLSNTTGDGTGDDDVAWDAVAVVPGDFSGMPEVDFAAENPDAPDPDDVASQTPDDAPAPTDEGLSALAAKATAQDRDASSTAGACSAGSDEVQLCAGPYQPWSELSKGSSTAITPKSVGSQAVSSEPVPWCKTAPGSDFQYTRTQGCLRGGYALYVKDDNGDVIGGGNVKVVQEIKLDPTSNQFTTWTEFSLPDLTGVASATLDDYFEDCWAMSDCTADAPGAWNGSTTWTEGDQHTASRTDTYSWNKVAGGQSTLGLDWNTSWSSPGTTTTANNQWKDTAFAIRCDNQVGGNTGCVFPKVTPTLFLTREKYPAAAAYYWVLMEKLASHPGSKKYKSPLHRLADDTTAQNNRNKMCLLAVAEWNPNPEAIGASCDEYPFAKSRESGGMTLASGKSCVQMYAVKNSDGTYTLKLDENYAYPTWNEICGRAAITSSQNSAAGGALGRFTTAVRLLDNDAYYVNTGYESCDLSEVCDLS